MLANVRYMKPPTLGQEIRRLRLETGTSLRGFAKKVAVSAAHLSDIEHDRRRPSEALLRRIARELRSVGATFDALEKHVTGLDEATRDWVASTPGARALLRKVAELGVKPDEILPALDRVLKRRTQRFRRAR